MATRLAIFFRFRLFSKSLFNAAPSAGGHFCFDNVVAYNELNKVDKSRHLSRSGSGKQSHVDGFKNFQFADFLDFLGQHNGLNSIAYGLNQFKIAAEIAEFVSKHFIYMVRDAFSHLRNSGDIAQVVGRKIDIHYFCNDRQLR